MSFNPVDIIRTQEAAQIKHMQNQKTQYMQEQFGKNFQHLIEHEKHKPTEPAKTENSDYRYDAKEKGSNQYQGDIRKRKENKKEKNMPKRDKSTKEGGLDILI